MTDTTGARVQRERDFHNQRFDDADARDEQKRFYWAIWEGAKRYMNVVADLAIGADALEYGCGDSGNWRRIGPLARTLTGIDISDTAIVRLRNENRLGNASYHVMDAHALTFHPASFDLVFGSGIVHHLDTATAAREVSRVLRPNGKAVFWEPLGGNPLIDAYRSSTPDARTPDEHPLKPVDFAILRRYFRRVDIEFYGLFTLASVPFQNTVVGLPLYRAMRLIDRVVASVPGLRFLMWYSLIICSDPR